MPMYCFADKKGFFIHRMFTVEGCPRRLKIGRRRYTKQIVCPHGDIRAGSGSAKWPMLSEGAAVNPRQVAEMKRAIKDRGLRGVDVVPDGRIKLDTPKARRAFNKSFGYRDRNGFD